MAIDFSDLLDEGDEAVVHPRDIFFTLDRDSAFSFPRDIQTEVMNLWFDRRTQPDTIIKLNVGSGKTLVGLLLLQSALNERVSPSLYVAPDKQLVDQVLKEAEALGVPVTDDPRDPSFEAGERIAIVNIYKLFNGRSVFGIGDEGARIKLGAVVIDDAHACVATVSQQFRITLPNTHKAYRAIFNMFADDLKCQSEAKFLDVEDSDPHAIMEVPFWAWWHRQSEVLAALRAHRGDEALTFSYPLLSEILPLCRCIIGGQKLEIEPPFPATDLVRAFRNAKRRIYMTATLSNDSVIVTHFGADPNTLSAPIVPTSSQSMGERMILMPQELNPHLDLGDIKGLLVRLSKKHNVVVIVPSKLAAKTWEDDAGQVLMGDQVAPGVAKLRTSHVGLTVLINRYDGIDLPGNACRVLAIVDLPEVSSYGEIADAAVLSGSAHALRRHMERIEQGIGRGVRSNDDYCAVLLVGSRLIRRVKSPDGDALLTPATRAQMNLSRKLARKLEEATVGDIESVIRQCLDRDPSWVKVSKKALVGLEAHDELRLDPSSLAIRRAFDLARSDQYQAAVDAFAPAVEAASDDQEKAWLLSRKAAFQHALDAEAAQKTLLTAHKLERGVMKPLQGVGYRKLSAKSGEQASAILAFHNERFLTATDRILFAKELCADLRFHDVPSDRFEATVNELARFIGATGQRPEKEFGEGPDNLWALPGGAFYVIECKNNAVSETGISKTDTGQLGQSMAWLEKRYPVTPVTPIMVHPLRTLGPGASAVPCMRIIDQEKLDKLKKAIVDFATSLADPDVSSSAKLIVKHLADHGLNADVFLNRFTTPLK